MIEHAELAPSSAHRRWLCPGSRALEAAIPEVDGPEAQEGTAAHWVLEQLINTDLLPEIGTLAPNAIPVDKAMYDGALLAVNEIAEAIGPDWRAWTRVEQTLPSLTIHPLCWGTRDVRAWVPHMHTLFLFDYKYGHGYVEVFENPQLIEYLAGDVSYEWPNGTHDDTQIKFAACIIQPRGYFPEGPVRWWRGTLSDLRPHFNYASSCEHRSMEPNAPTIAGPEQCKDCRARVKCVTNLRANAHLMDRAGDPTTFEPTPTHIGLELTELMRARKMIDARISGLEEQGMQCIATGKRVPGWQIDHAKARERWNQPVEDVIAMGHSLGKDLAKPAEAITPAQARSAGIDNVIIEAYSYRPPGERKLVPENLKTMQRALANEQ
jgi:hypothetical protein